MSALRRAKKFERKFRVLVSCEALSFVARCEPVPGDDLTMNVTARLVLRPGTYSVRAFSRELARRFGVSARTAA